jgi:Domain of unknown function (DUF4387)
MSPTMTDVPGNRLRDIASMIRSKNAGPFVLTIDLFFDSLPPCQRVVNSGVITAKAIGELFGVDPDQVFVTFVPQAVAVKITLPRPVSAGDVGDNDVAGGQQFARILDIEIPPGPAAPGAGR